MQLDIFSCIFTSTWREKGAYLLIENKKLTSQFPINLEEEWHKTYEEMAYSEKNWIGICLSNLEIGSVFDNALTIVRNAIETELFQKPENWTISEVPVYEPTWAIIIFWNEQLQREFHIGVFADNKERKVTLEWLYFDEEDTDCEAANLKEAYEKDSSTA